MACSAPSWWWWWCLLSGPRHLSQDCRWAKRHTSGSLPGCKKTNVSINNAIDVYAKRGGGNAARW